MSVDAKWPNRRLGDIAEFRNGVNYNKSSFGVGVKVVGVSDFQDYTKPRYDELEQINPEGIVTARNILHDGRHRFRSFKREQGVDWPEPFHRAAA